MGNNKKPDRGRNGVRGNGKVSGSRSLIIVPRCQRSLDADLNVETERISHTYHIPMCTTGTLTSMGVQSPLSDGHGVANDFPRSGQLPSVLRDNAANLTLPRQSTM